MRTPSFIASVVVLLLITSGCAAKKEKEAQPTGLQFHWDTPVQFQIEETVEKKGKRTKLDHTIRVAETNGELSVRWIDIIRLPSDEQSTDKPNEREALAELYKATGMRISRDGHFLSAIGFKDAVKVLEDFLDQTQTNRPTESKKALSRLIDTPQGQKLADHQENELWSTWVEAWLGRTLKPYQSVTNYEEQSSSFAPDIKSKIVFSHLGFAPNSTNEFHLRCEQIAGGPEYARAVLKGFESMGAGMGSSNRPKLPAMISATNRVTVEVYTDPLTLRPSWAKRSIETTFQTVDSGTMTSRESHEYRFIWPSE